MFSLAVALGCDLFDSAAYALYARENRYMTENGTWRLEEMDYFPCSCPRCATMTPQELLQMPKKEREIFLAEHNLWVCQAELKRIKQAIRNGRLWEHTEMRCHAHPALLSALKRVKGSEDFLEAFSPTTKDSGFFFYDSVGLARPEITHYQNHLKTRYQPPANAKTLLLVPQTRNKPFHKAPELKKIRQTQRSLGENVEQVHVCVYCAPFGVVPLELDEIYPLSQHETVLPLEQETIAYVAAQTVEFIKRGGYQGVVLLNDSKLWNGSIKDACESVCKSAGLMFECLEVQAEAEKKTVARLKTALCAQLGC
jgi:7-cyano-7-deazaguanine tRNA-ribosyltransferase